MFPAAAAALLLLAVAAYAQWRIPAFTRGVTKATLARALLFAVGIGFGWTSTLYARESLFWPAFLIGFGLVHVPAALVLFLKGRRGEGPS